MKRLALFFALVLLLAACGDTDLATEEPAAAQPADTTAAPVIVTEAPVDDSTHDDEASQDDAAAHDEDEPGHDDDPAAHTDDEAADHDDDAAHDGEMTDEMADELVDADRSVEVVLSEFAFEPGDFEVAAGETIEFVVTNTGVVEHEFRLSNGHRIEEHLAAGHADHDEGGTEGHHENGDISVLVPPGETASVAVAFTDDATLFTEVVCLIPGHYEAGMKAPLGYSA